MNMFFSELTYRTVNLWTPADVVQHSFIVQKSILHLNLELCQSYILWTNYENSNYPSYSHSKDFISTEEKCRKVHTPRRSLLYTMHLDFPRGKEWRLKGHAQPTHAIFYLEFIEIFHISQIFIYEHFYYDILLSLVNYACQSPGLKLKILKWFLKLDLEEHVFLQLPDHIINNIIDCLHPDLEDSEFVTKCFSKLDLITWLRSNSSTPGRVTNLLYHNHRLGRNAQAIWNEEFIDLFFTLQSFQFVGDVLNLKSTLSFSDDFHDCICQDISLIRNSMILNRDAEVMSRQRQILLLQVFWVYLNRSSNPAATSEYLRLIWNSVPDSLIRPYEFIEAFELGFSHEETDAVCHFYSEAVGGLPVSAEPRSLQHYSRTIIRRRLHERQIWLPEGIEELDLPPNLKLYCNLE